MDLPAALKQYTSTLNGDARANAQRELHLFVRWCGRQRLVDQLRPPEVEEYAKQLARSGGDVADRLSHLKGFLTYMKRRGLVSISLATHVKIPKGRAGVPTPAHLREEAVQLTRQGFDALQQEMVALKAERHRLADDIKKAAADKDVRENAPLEAAREHQGWVQSRIRELEDRLRRAVVMAEGGVATLKVQIGSVVVLHEEGTQRSLTYTLVDPAEANPTQGKVSVASPVGKGLLGRWVGEDVEITVPQGTVRYRIASLGP